MILTQGVALGWYILPLQGVKKHCLGKESQKSLKRNKSQMFLFLTFVWVRQVRIFMLTSYFFHIQGIGCFCLDGRQKSRKL